MPEGGDVGPSRGSGRAREKTGAEVEEEEEEEERRDRVLGGEQGRGREKRPERAESRRAKRSLVGRDEGADS